MSHTEEGMPALPDDEYLTTPDTQPGVSGMGRRVSAAA